MAVVGELQRFGNAVGISRLITLTRVIVRNKGLG
jgi:hypothetical protein